MDCFYLHHTYTASTNFIKSNNSGKTTCTLFNLDPVEFNTRLNPQINNTILDRNTYLNIGTPTDNNKHIDSTIAKASKTMQILEVLYSIKRGENKETLLSTYKAVTRQILEYASNIWSPIAATTNIKKLYKTHCTLHNCNWLYT